MSISSPALKQSFWKNQPSKGIIFIALIAGISLLFEFVFGQLLRLDVSSKLIYITIAFLWWWHLGFSLNGYPGSRFSSSRLGRGTVNLAIFLGLVNLTGEFWKYISGTTSLNDTSVGLWGQTAIIAAAASLFFFDNTIVTNEKFRQAFGCKFSHFFLALCRNRVPDWPRKRHSGALLVVQHSLGLGVFDGPRIV